MWLFHKSRLLWIQRFLFIHISLELAAKRQKQRWPTSPSANMTSVTLTSRWSSRRGNEKIFAAHDLMRETRHGHMCCSGMLTYSYPAASFLWKWVYLLHVMSPLSLQWDNHQLSPTKIELDSHCFLWKRIQTIVRHSPIFISRFF